MNFRIALLFSLAAAACPAADIASPNFTVADLFVTTKIWNAHLTITPDQWKFMQPIQVNRQAERRAHPEKASRNGFLAAQGVEFRYAHGDLDFEGKVFHDVGVRFKGNGTYLNSVRSYMGGPAEPTDKVPYKIHLNEFVKGQKLGAGINILDFRNNITDASWMNEVLGYRMYRDAGVPSPRTTYARLYLTSPGKMENRLLGLYSLSEDVGPPMLAEHFSDGKGTLLKPSDLSAFSLFRYRGDSWADYVQTLDPKEAMTPADQKRIIDFCRLVSKASDTELAQQLGNYVDLAEFARFMAVTVWLSDGDGVMDSAQNFYAYLDPRSQKLSFIPWDLDHSFGQFPQRLNQKQRETRPLLPPWYRSNPFLERVFKVPAFRERYLAHMREFSRTLFDPVRLAAQVDQLAPYIRPAVAEQAHVAHSDALERFDKAIAGQALSLREFGDGDIVPIKPFAVHRAKFVNDQLDRLRIP